MLINSGTRYILVIFAPFYNFPFPLIDYSPENTRVRSASLGIKAGIYGHSSSRINKITHARSTNQ